MVRVLVGIRGCVPRPTGHNLVTLFSLSMSVKDRSLHWILVRSHVYYPEYILVYGSRKGSLLSCRGFLKVHLPPVGFGVLMTSKLGTNVILLRHIAALVP